MTWLWKLTGGRPMVADSGVLFVDVISGEEVRRYRDKLGRYWLATGKWAWFRVHRSNRTAGWQYGRGEE